MNELSELLQAIKSDLVSRRLLPVLVVSIVTCVGAVAYAATSAGSGSAPSSVTPSSEAPSPAGAAGTVPVSIAPANSNEAIAETPGGSRLQTKAPERDPFLPLPGANKGTSSSSSSSSSSGTSGSSGKGSSGSSSGSAKSGKSNAGASTGGSTPAAPTKPPAKVAPKPVHEGLTSTQSYEIGLSLTSQGGNLDEIESLERLGGLPSENQPLLVYLGVLEGGKDALFVVQPGTVVSGPGACTPGPTDCEILSLAPGQIENLAVSAAGGDSEVALFAVTAIRVDDHPSVAAAEHARREAAASGRALLAGSTLPSLALFEYQPNAGVVVDLRNLAVGGEK